MDKDRAVQPLKPVSEKPEPPLLFDHKSNVAQLKANKDTRYLIELLLASASVVRKDAAVALGQLHADDSVRHLISALWDSEDFVRERAAWALGEIGDAQAVNSLNRVSVKDTSNDVRQSATEALTRIREAQRQRTEAENRAKIRQAQKQSAERNVPSSSRTAAKDLANTLTRVHVYSQQALSDVAVTAVVKKLCPRAFATFPEPRISYSHLPAWAADMPAYLVARFCGAGFNDSDFRADQITFEEGEAWGSPICVVSISHPKGRDLLL